MGGPRGPCPLTAACASPFQITQNTFLSNLVPTRQHLVPTRQQTKMEKGIITLKHNSRLKVSSILYEIAANQLWA